MYLDFAKAFDKVDIFITLPKLKSLGIPGENDRWQEICTTTCYIGCPSGSVLGPLLFLIRIGDINQNIAFSFISSFVDDTRVGRHIENFEDIQLLQADLDAVYNWAESNTMEFNSDKFELLRHRLRGSTV